MAKSFLSYLQSLQEAPLPPPPPGGPLGGPGGGGPLGVPGGMPPPPPMGGGMGGPPSMGGGLGGGLGGGMGGDMTGQKPIPVKTIDAMDVWDILKKATKDMDKHEELSLHYGGHKSKQTKKPSTDKQKSSLIS